MLGNKNPAKRPDVRKKLRENNAMHQEKYRNKVRDKALEQWQDPIIRKRRIDSMQNIPKTKEAKINMSKARIKLLSDNPEFKKKMMTFRNGKMTDIEKIMQEILIHSGLKENKDFCYNYPISGLPYIIDFALLNSKIALECDGENWHSSLDARKKDDRRDNELEEIGWKTIRFSGKTLKNEPDKVLETILSL
jgi:very-short-patch-repair endonuclease